ncbi:hypothetical protein V6N12_018526 [Hibiscus sabdariffa]|uniref:Putative plant transposon protein domain-containing protein n=1 Tax=Hibiscus sabdariffa TaxID=183260 RepID=A0ABR2BY91_9ROSI
MAHSSSSSAKGLPSRFRNAAARARYNNIVAAQKNGRNKRLSDLGWLCFDRKAAQANLKWAREFYAHKDEGNDAANVRGRRVPANSATINTLLDLLDNLPSIYELIGALEDVDYDIIKDQLCLSGTTWNITGKNPGTISRPQLLPEEKLWNTFVKRSLMPTSHNQTVDRTRLVLINAIITGFKFNVGETVIPTPPANHQSPVETPAPSPADAQSDTPAANPMDSLAHTPEAPASFVSTQLHHQSTTSTPTIPCLNYRHSSATHSAAVQLDPETPIIAPATITSPARADDSPAKRRRRYHVVSSDNDDDDNDSDDDGSADPASSKSLAF